VSAQLNLEGENARSEGKAVNASKVEEIKRIVANAVSVKLSSKGGESTNSNSNNTDLFSSSMASQFCSFYQNLDMDSKKKLMKMLNQDFGVVHEDLDASISEYSSLKAKKADNPKAIHRAIEKLRHSSTPLYNRLFSIINQQPNGMNFLVELRAELLEMIKSDHADTDFHIIDDNLRQLLQSWFSVGNLELININWNSPASLLEWIIQNEAVHKMKEWGEMKERIYDENNGRCYGFVHRSMGFNNPLVFIQIALMNYIAHDIQALLNQFKQNQKEKEFILVGQSKEEEAQDEREGEVRCAIFYSITSPHAGLQGIDLGNYLIKTVVSALKKDFPSIQHFSTLSPIPGFRTWLFTQIAFEKNNHFNPERREILTANESATILKFYPQFKSGVEVLEKVLSDNEWHRNEKLSDFLRTPLMRNAANYLWKEKKRQRAIDSVCNFHIKNGAYLWRLNWKGDLSEKGLKEAFGIMVNYKYVLEDIHNNNQNYIAHGIIPVSPQVTMLSSLQ